MNIEQRSKQSILIYDFFPMSPGLRNSGD